MQDAEDDQAGGGRAPRARAVPPITPDERRRRRGHKRLPVLRTRGLPAVPRSSQRHPVRPHATLTSNPPALRGTCCSCATNFQHVMVFVHPPRRHTQACRTVPGFRELRVRQSMFRDVPPVPAASQCPPATPATEQHGRCGRVRLSPCVQRHACRYELSSDRAAAGGFATCISHDGRLLPWQTTHHLLKTFYFPLLFCPRGFVQGLRCVLGALLRAGCAAPTPIRAVPAQYIAAVLPAIGNGQKRLTLCVSGAGPAP